MKKKVKGHFRLTNKGYVYVKPYTREYKGTQTIDVEDALFKVFSWEGMSLTHSVSRDYSNKEDNIGAAILLGMSSDDGYSNMLNQRNTFEGKYLLKKVDSFIDRHGDTPCIGLFSGVPISKGYFKNLKTKVRVVSSPTPIGEGTKDFHYLVKGFVR